MSWCPRILHPTSTPLPVLDKFVVDNRVVWCYGSAALEVGDMPSSKTVIKVFPASRIGVVHQTGDVLVAPRKGVEVRLNFKNSVPYSAEISDLVDSECYADVGLTVVNNELIDYDGVFELPQEIIAMLREHHITVRHEPEH